VSSSAWNVKAWPGRALPHPEPEPPFFARWELDEGGAFVGRGTADQTLFDDAPAADSGPPFDEIYLRLAAVDPERDLDIIMFVEEYGPIDLYEPHEAARPAGFAVTRAPYPMLAAYPGFDGLEEFDLVPQVVAEAQAARARVVDIKAVEDGLVSPPATIQEMRWAVRCMRDLVSTYRCLSEQRPTTDFEWANPLIAYDLDGQRTGNSGPFWTTEGYDLPEFLSDSLEIGLRDVSPRLVFRDDLQPEKARDWAEHFPFPLWSVCCLELFNHIVEGALIKDCANERCRRPFVRQIGRSAHGQRRRTGVRFCSDSCARAQAQRQYARRRRAASS
jgi:hypothetical protein